ncbi:UrcA family protein [Gluconobacter sp. R75690]|uniref:UrcA family protein n=1 Tax=Gluconobacter TaxID=441 RepID=UPI00188A1CDE|nr:MULTISPECIES: UrcA family protein [unclassified Gluconobacter]MBF0851852.1 UrcA family protein [Gluconobacter sp. R75690]MBF0880391.1 UrcA family protein [Gluconobacter sp. R75828]
MIRFSSLLICALSASIVLPLQAARAIPTSAGTTSASTTPASTGRVSMRVDLSSLDLTSRKGWETATQQVTQASHAVCHQLQEEDWLLATDVTDCEQDALSDARTSLYDLRDQQRASRRNGHVFLALSARK